MMTTEHAVNIAEKFCTELSSKIQKYENERQAMDAWKRQQFGMVRRFMFEAGVPHDQLPEVPFLEPEHLENWRKNRAEREAAKVDA